MRPLALPSALVVSLLAFGCSDAIEAPTDAGADVIRRGDAGTISLYLSPAAGYEGQRRFVAQLSPAYEGDDLSDATIAAEDPSAGFVLDQRQCTRDRCAIAAHLDDVTPDRGAPIPSVMEGRRVRIITRGRVYTYSSTLTVFPLDAANASSVAAGRLPERAVYSSLDVPSGVTLRPTGSTEPVRIIVMGAINLHGRIDLSPAMDNTAVAGGASGGASGAAGGDMGGAGHSIAGGGGGYLRAGSNGRTSDGMTGGAGGATRGDRLLTTLRGGSGGGGGSGLGGAGGGALLLVGFGAADLTGAVFDARGGSGDRGGGGGSGGALFLAASTVQGAGQVDLRGGAGGTYAMNAGGDGSPGRLRIDGSAEGLSVMGAEAVAGPSFDVPNIPAIVRTAMVPLRGSGTPGTMIRVRDELSDGHPTVTATVGADGRWSATLALPAVGNPARLVLSEVQSNGSFAPSFSGSTLSTHVEGGTLVFDGAALDLVFLPPG